MNASIFLVCGIVNTVMMIVSTYFIQNGRFHPLIWGTLAIAHLLLAATSFTMYIATRKDR